MIVGTICGQYLRLYPKWLRRIQDTISSSILQQLITSIAKKDKCEDRSFCGKTFLAHIERHVLVSSGTSDNDKTCHNIWP